MPDASPDVLAPLRALLDAVDDPDLLASLRATVELLERDTATVIEQTLISADIAARTRAGDWFQNTELMQIGADAGSILRQYKAQRSALAALKTALEEKADSAAP